ASLGSVAWLVLVLAQRGSERVLVALELTLVVVPVVVLGPVDEADLELAVDRGAALQDAAGGLDESVVGVGHVLTTCFCQHCWNANRAASTSWRWSAWSTPSA